MRLFLGFDDRHPFSKVDITEKASVQELLKTLLDPLEPFFSPGKARVRCPGATAVRFDQTASEVEGLLRPLWGLGCLLAGDGEYHGTKWWIDGIKAGIDPAHPETWGWPQDNDQRMVEMCPLGFALAVAPPIWQSFSTQDKKNMEAWLGNSINEKNMPNTNWLWFRVFANLGLKKNGGVYSQERLESDIEHLDTFYRGDGWSNDGPEGIHQMDYYSSSFAIQFLQLLYAKIAGDDDPERTAEFKRRAQVAALDLAHYYDDEGRAIPYGRSMVYRFAAVSFWGALAYADVDLPEPLTWGMVKGIVMRNLRWWQKQHDMWTSSGTLSLGYTYPNMYMTENYNSPGSPYWACLAFICLAVPETHPFWTSAEEFPQSVIPKIKSLKHPGHIITNLGGHCMLLSSGQACGYPMKATHAKYSAFAYSSAFGYSVPPDDGGELWKTRRVCEEANITVFDGNPVLVSKWKPYADVTITTLLIPSNEKHPNWHLRAHKIEAGREVKTADGSFAIRNINSENGRYLGLYDEERAEGTSPKIIGNYDLNTPVGWAEGRDGAFAVSQGAVGIKALETHSPRRAMLVNADPNSNIMESRTTFPTLQHTMKAGEAAWYISGIFAKPAAEGVGKATYLDGWNHPPSVPDWLTSFMRV